MKFSMTAIPVCVSMFVYINVASAVNNRAPGGHSIFFSSLIIVVDSFV